MKTMRIFVATILAFLLFPAQAVFAAGITNPPIENPPVTAEFSTLDQAQEAGVAGTIPDDPSAYQSDSMIVVYKDATPTATDVNSVEGGISSLSVGQEDVSSDVISTVDGQAVAAVDVPSDVSLDQAMLEAANNDAVAYVQPNYYYSDFATTTTTAATTGTAAATSATAATAIQTLAASPLDYSQPNDPYFTNGSQWYLNSIFAPTAWDKARVNHKVTVAVVDTGARLTHLDLAANLAKDASGKVMAWDATQNCYLASSSNYGAGFGDLNGHGTHVSGLVAAVTDNGIGIAGDSYNADVLPINVFYWANVNGQVSLVADTSTLIAAYNYVAKEAKALNIRVVNMSLGTYQDPGSSSTDSALYKAEQSATAAGILTVAAAGNDNTSTPVYPSDWPDVCSVVAVGANNVKASYSNYNANKDIAAPGGDNGMGILSLGYTSNTAYATMMGTSMAAPLVSGAAALLFSINPALTPAQVKSLLCSTARDQVGDYRDTPGRDDYYGYGLLDVQAAVDQLIANPPKVAAMAPTITAQPASPIFYKGQKATALKVTAKSPDGGTLKYQWYSNTANSKTGAKAISGATGASYTPPTKSAGIVYYFCRVTNTKSGASPATKTADSKIVAVRVAADFNNTVVTVVPDAKTGLRLEIPGQSKASGAQAGLWSNNNGANQRYLLVRDANGLYRLKNVNSGLYLTVKGGKAANGAAIVQSASSTSKAQRFMVSYEASGKYTLVSALDTGYVIAVSGSATSASSVKSAAKIVLQKRNTASATQVFRLGVVKPVIASGTVVTIRNYMTGRYMDVCGVSMLNYAQVLTWSATGGQNQKFRIDFDAATGYYYIVPLNSSKPLTLYASHLFMNGSTVFQYTKTTALRQQWDIRKNSNGTYTFYQPNSGFALSACGGSKTLGTPVIIWPVNGAGDQSWVFKKQ